MGRRSSRITARENFSSDEKLRAVRIVIEDGGKKQRMKIRMSIPGAAVVVDVEEDRARDIFRDIAQMLLNQNLGDETCGEICGPGLLDQDTREKLCKK